MGETTDFTTISVPESVKARLDEQRGARPWGAFLEQLRQEHADPITLNDAEAIADHVAERVESEPDTGELALAVADYLMTEYELPRKVANELEGRR